MRLPPLSQQVEDDSGHPIALVLASHRGLIIKRGTLRFDVSPSGTLTLLRWLIWHALHGRFAPRSGVDREQ